MPTPSIQPTDTSFRRFRPDDQPAGVSGGALMGKVGRKLRRPPFIHDGGSSRLNYLSGEWTEDRPTTLTGAP